MNKSCYWTIYNKECDDHQYTFGGLLIVYYSESAAQREADSCNIVTQSNKYEPRMHIGNPPVDHERW